MPFRLLALFAMLVLAAIPASGVALSPADSSLRPAADHYRYGAYRSCYDAALQAPESPERTFLMGMSAYRTEQWDTAADLLGKGAESYRLLADFALYYRADALCRLGRFDDALPLLQRIKTEFPESPLSRKGVRLTADAWFGKKDCRAALAAYQQFIEQYPSGQDSVSASFQMALCREEMGDRDAAAARYRAIRLDYPASPFAERAGDALSRLAAQGTAVRPYTPEEQFQRGNTLYSLQHYTRALEVFRSISSSTLPTDLRTRVALKRGQAQYRSRRFRDAEQTFAGLNKKQRPGEAADEIAFWHARALDRNGKEDDAVAAYLQVAESWPRSTLADDALLYAALVRKHQGKWNDARSLMGRITANYPDSGLKQTALWETGWAAYQAKDYPAAAAIFGKLVASDDFREKALYWTGRAQQAAGDPDGAQKTYAALRDEFPLGYYTSQYLTAGPAAPAPQPLITGDIADLLPPASPPERAAALIGLGMYEEARMELAAVKKRSSAKGRQNVAIARTYLEMGDFSSAAAALRQDPPRKLNRDNLYLWGINYPNAFRNEIARFSTANGLDPSLVFALVRAESRFSPRALSPVGARGLMQLMPDTARAVDKSADPDQLYQPELNLRLGTRHLKDLIDRYNGNLVPVIASYNAGSGNVDRWLKAFGAMDQSEFIENIPFPETRDYVKKVLAGREIYRRLYLPSSAMTAHTTAAAAD